MAYVDYKHCDIRNTKVFYDANLNYDFEDYPLTGLYDLDDWKTICTSCSKLMKLLLIKREARNEYKYR